MIKSRSQPQLPASNKITSGGELLSQHPFRLNISSINDTLKKCSVSVNPNSQILKSDDVLDTVDLLGKNLSLDFPYGHKIWLEVFFDSSRAPVIGMIKTGAKWEGQVKNSSGVLEDVYPSCVEMISRQDIVAKTSELDSEIAYITTIQGLSDNELEYQADNGIITSDQYSQLLSLSSSLFDAHRATMRQYKSDLSRFFSAAPSQQWKKLFKLYRLIGYSTKDPSAKIPGSKLFFSNEGAPTAPAVPQAEQKSDYKIVQCLDSDLLVVNSWHLDIYPSKSFMQYSRPVHTFYIGQDTEEQTNVGSE